MVETNGEFGDPAWFRDDRLHGPGNYRLQLILGNVVGEQPLESFPTSELHPSNVASFHVLEPAGDDAVVWKTLGPLLKSIPTTKEALEKGQLAKKDLAVNYPRSAYTGWLLASGVGTDATESNERLRRWLEIHSGDKHEDWRWMIVARHEADRFAVGTEAEAMLLQKEVRSIMKRLRKTQKSERFKRKADQILSDVDGEQPAEVNGGQQIDE